MDKYVQAARLRIRELEAASKMSKRELRRARKTIKTYELLAVLNDGRLPVKDATATGTLGSTFTHTQHVQPAPPPQVGSLRTECPQGTGRYEGTWYRAPHTRTARMSVVQGTTGHGHGVRVRLSGKHDAAREGVSQTAADTSDALKQTASGSKGLFAGLHSA